MSFDLRTLTIATIGCATITRLFVLGGFFAPVRVSNACDLTSFEALFVPLMHCVLLGAGVRDATGFGSPRRTAAWRDGCASERPGDEP